MHRRGGGLFGLDGPGGLGEGDGGFGRVLSRRAAVRRLNSLSARAMWTVRRRRTAMWPSAGGQVSFQSMLYAEMAHTVVGQDELEEVGVGHGGQP